MIKGIKLKAMFSDEEKSLTIYKNYDLKQKKANALQSLDEF